MRILHPETVHALQSTGWEVSSTRQSASRRMAGLIARIYVSGAWRVARGHNTVSDGKESHAAFAAMECNEILWMAREAIRLNERHAANLTR